MRALRESDSERGRGTERGMERRQAEEGEQNHQTSHCRSLAAHIILVPICLAMFVSVRAGRLLRGVFGSEQGRV